MTPDPLRDKAAERAWHRLRVLCIGVGVACAAVDMSLKMYGWAAWMFGCAAFNVWLDQRQKR